MSEQILVPALGESITEATVSKWLKKPGEKVIADDPIVELETDIVNLEVPSPIDGVFAEQQANEGDTVKVMETRPLSKSKRWRLVEIIEKAK